MRTKTAIAIFVKTPGLSPLKTRLAATIGEAQALSFYQLSLNAIKETLKDVQADIYWASAEQNASEHAIWADFPVIWTGEGGFGTRQHHIYSQLQESHEQVILIGADSPQIPSAVFVEAIKALEDNAFVIGPAADGGYYLFGGKTPVAQAIWENVEYSAPTTRSRLTTQLNGNIHEMTIYHDVDEAPDLKAIMHEMPEKPNEAQGQLIRWIQALELS